MMEGGFTFAYRGGAVSDTPGLETRMGLPADSYLNSMRTYSPAGQIKDRLNLSSIAKTAEWQVPELERKGLEGINELAVELSEFMGLTSFQSYLVKTGARILYSIDKAVGAGIIESEDDVFGLYLDDYQEESEEHAIETLGVACTEGLMGPRFLTKIVKDAIGMATGRNGADYSTADTLSQVIVAVYNLNSMVQQGYGKADAVECVMNALSDVYLTETLFDYLTALEMPKPLFQQNASACKTEKFLN